MAAPGPAKEGCVASALTSGAEGGVKRAKSSITQPRRSRKIPGGGPNASAGRHGLGVERLLLSELQPAGRRETVFHGGSRAFWNLIIKLWSAPLHCWSLQIGSVQASWPSYWAILSVKCFLYFGDKESMKFSMVSANALHAFAVLKGQIKPMLIYTVTVYSCV